MRKILACVLFLLLPVAAFAQPTPRYPGIKLGTASSETGLIEFYNALSAHFTAIQAGNAAASVTYTLPTNDGTGGYFLQTNGSGALSWAAAVGQVPACPQTAANSICYNSTNGYLVWEGATANDFEGSLAATDPTADRVWTLPDATGTLPLLGSSQSWSGTNTHYADVVFRSNHAVGFGNTPRSGIRWNLGLTPDNLVLYTNDSGGNALHIIEHSDNDAGYDFNNGPCGTSDCSNPTVVFHSANQSTTEWIAIWHDQTVGKIGSPGGVAISDEGSKSSCDASHRGAMWRDEGGSGVADTFEVCAKNSSDTYDWYALATIP